MATFDRDDMLIAYMEDQDFDSSGKPKFNHGNKPTVLMIQGSFCGYCTQAKPDFVNAALSDKSVNWGTIQIDGGSSEKALIDKISPKLSNYRGVPTYIAITPQGKIIEYDGGRDTKSILAFVKSL